MRRSLLRRRFNCARIASLWFEIEEQKQSMWSDFASPLEVSHRARTLRAQFKRVKRRLPEGGASFLRDLDAPELSDGIADRIGE